ncbi:MAG: asparaginase [Rhodobacteraceae bacterium]|nr:asparaginase [Paracoccaceae bacterium]
MGGAVKLVELHRNGIPESVHRGHVVVWGPAGIVAEWGQADKVIFPRSACKMLQALPLVESGAAASAGLLENHLALACASHQGADMHTRLARSWLKTINLDEADLRCGPQTPNDRHARAMLREAFTAPCQLHNNCSGKHTGFLTLGQHLGAGPEYIELDHPVQKAVREAFEALTGAPAPGYGIDGCSAPNFTCEIAHLARAMAHMARPEGLGKTRANAARALIEAMMAHPLLVAGENRACSALMAAAGKEAAIKTGAEGVFVAILPTKGLGIALKIEDGSSRASEAVMAALLVRLGVVQAKDPRVAQYLHRPEINRRGIKTGEFIVNESLFAGGRPL